MKLYDKFLSHRLRGFDQYEHTLKGMREIIKTNIPYIEIDVRVSKDGIMFVHHDDKIISDMSSILISKNTSKEIHKFITTHHLPIDILENFLSLFVKRSNKNQRLFLDIKDYGYEKEYCEIVKKYHLENDVTWVSWIPQTILKLDTILPNSQKMLSYIPIPTWLSQIVNVISIVHIPFSPFVLIGQKNYNSSLGGLSLGFQHAYFSTYLNPHLLRILSKNKSGVCIPKFMLSKELLHFYDRHKLCVAIFSATSLKEYQNYRSKNIDIIFSDFIDKDIVDV